MTFGYGRYHRILAVMAVAFAGTEIVVVVGRTIVERIAVVGAVDVG